MKVKGLPKILLPAVMALVSTLAVWLVVGMDKVYRNFDGVYYVAIAKTWYDRDLIRSGYSFNLPVEYYPAHLPLYPMLISLGTKFGVNHMQSMMAVSLVTAMITATAFYAVLRKMKIKAATLLTILLLFAWPRMWAVRSVGSPEMLFLGLVVGSLYFFDRRNYWLAGILGAFAVWTKSPGILLLVAYAVQTIVQYIRTRKINWQVWPVGIIGMALLGLFYFYYLRTGDFWAYFNTGDNIHLGLLPFRIFDTRESWVGSFWLEDVIWLYLVGGIGVWMALKKNLTWGIFGAVFYAFILFVSHRDVSRYALPIVPSILLGSSDFLDKKETKIAIALLLIPLFLYTVGFVSNNTLEISNWSPLL